MFYFKYHLLIQFTIFFQSSDLFNLNNYPEYDEYIVNSVDLQQLHLNIQNRKYKSTDSFLADAQWLLHNLYIFFPDSTKLTSLGKNVVKVCKQEMYEIETCHECYYNANTRKEWFTEVCSRPHILLWAKLKSFPYWPAKAMVVNPQQLVSVRFFGDHDRAWVPVKDCFLYSDKDPNINLKSKRNNIAESIKELDIHIEKIRAKFGDFKYMELRTPYDPKRDDEQLQMMIPTFSKFSFDAKNTKSKLTYKIVKTADNNMSISPVLNGGGGSGSLLERTTSTPTSSILKREDESSVPFSSSASAAVPSAKKTTKFTTGKALLGRRPNTDDGDDKTKTYQVMRRKSTIDRSTVVPAKKIREDDDSDEEKLEKMIIKRKSDNWNTITIPLKRRRSQGANGVAPVNKSRTANTSDISSDNSDDDGINDPVDKIKVFTIKQPPSAPKGKQKKGTDESRPVGSILVGRPSRKKSPIEEIAAENNTESPIEDTVEKDPLDLKAGETKPNDEPKTSNESSSIKTGADADESREEVVDTAVETKHEKIPQKNSSNDEPTTTKEAAPKVVEKNVSTKNLRSQKRLTTAKSVEDVVPEKLKEVKPTSTSSELFTIKLEPMSDDETPNNGESIDNDSQLTTDSSPTLLKAIGVASGFVTVRDIKKMRNPSSTAIPSSISTRKQALVVRGSFPEPIMVRGKSVKTQRARKTFPSKSIKQLPVQTTTTTATVTNPNSTNTSFTQNSSHNISRIPTAANNSVLPALNVYQNIKNTSNNMVYIPMDSKHNRTVVTNDPINDFLRSSSMGVPPLVTVGGQMVLTSSTSQNQAPKADDCLSTTTIGGIDSSVTNGPKVPPLAPTSNNVQITSPATASATATASTSPSNNNVMASYLTPSLAAAITETLVRAPPKLTVKPSGPLRGDGNINLSAADAGPLSRKLTDNAYKMTDYFRAIIEETIGDLAVTGSLEARCRHLELELEKIKCAHAQEISELKHNTGEKAMIYF